MLTIATFGRSHCGLHSISEQLETPIAVYVISLALHSSDKISLQHCPPELSSNEAFLEFSAVMHAYY